MDGGFMLGVLMLMQNFPCAHDHIWRKTGELGDFYSIAAVSGSWLHFAQEDNAAGVLFYRDMEVLDSRQAIKLCEFVIMSREQSFGFAGGVDVFHNGPGDGQAIVGRGAAADFIQQDERAWRGGVEDRCR